MAILPNRIIKRGEGGAAVLTQPADGTVVGLVTQRVCAGVAETQVSAGQDEGVSQVRQTHNTLAAVVAVLIIRRLREERKATQTSRARGGFVIEHSSERRHFNQYLRFLVVLVLDPINLL